MCDHAVVDSVEVCDHCSLDAYYPIYLDDKVFCCHGCSHVYKLLVNNGLDNFYELKKEGVNFAPSSPVTLIPKEEYLYLDQKEFLSHYGVSYKDGSDEFSFYIEGITCLACLWLLEKLPEMNSKIVSSQFDLSKSKLTIRYKDIKLSEVAQLVSDLGYRAYPLKSEEEIKIREAKENRKELIRLAVCGMLAGNIMLFAVSLYGGAEGFWGKVFEWGSAILALPVLTYGAIPFYRSFLRDIKMRKMSLDTPIVLSLLLGTGIGLYHLALENPHHYFDSLTILVFLLLSSRFFLRMVKQKGLQLNHLTDFFLQPWTRVWDSSEDSFTRSHIDQLKTGDRIQVERGEIVPVDGKVLSGTSLINTALITGEFAPVRVKKNQKIYSGSEILDSTIEVEVEKVGKQSRLGEILEEVKGQWTHKNRLTRLTDKFAQYLISFVLLFAAGLFTYMAFNDLELATNRTLALIIITCPCALGLATPLAMVLGMKVAAKEGIIIKSDETLEKVSQIKKVFLDKTGTLTYGRFQVTDWSDESEELRSITYALEKESSHPIARSLIQYIESKGFSPVELEERVEKIGVGIEAKQLHNVWEIRSLSQISPIKSEVYQTSIGLYKNNECVSKIILEDTLRPDAQAGLKKFSKLGIRAHILSGDNEKSVKHIGKILGLEEKKLFYNASPEEKKQILANHQESMMVGDGANDALAFSQADVGVAIKGSMSISLKVADTYLTQPGIQGVLKLITISRETMKIVKRNIAFSLAYNVIGVTAACLGYVTPLWAAVFMPLSSVTVVSSTLWGTKKIREIKGGR